MFAPESGRTGDLLMAFLSILFEGAPYIVVGTIVSGLIDAFLPAKLLEGVLPKNRILATISAGFLGLVFPVVECASVPVVRRLVQKGLPISCAVTYLLSAPIINPVVIWSTWVAFLNRGVKGDNTHLIMTVGRVSLGYFIAVLVGLVLLRKKPADIVNPAIAEHITSGEEPKSRLPLEARLVHAMRTAMRDFLETAMYFTFGILITSFFNTQVDQTKIRMLAGNDWTGTPALMILAYVLALCSTSDAFIAASLQGFSHASKLAFLVFGPMLDIKLTFMYAAVFRRKFLLVLSVSLFVLAGLLSGPWVAALQRYYSHHSP